MSISDKIIIAVSGSRTINVESVIDEFLSNFIKGTLIKRLKLTEDNIKEKVIFHVGGANGVDTVVENILKRDGYEFKRFIPEWRKNGRYNPSAGHERNVLMAEGASFLFCVWDGESRGTSHMLNHCHKKKIRVTCRKISV